MTVPKVVSPSKPEQSERRCPGRNLKRLLAVACLFLVVSFAFVACWFALALGGELGGNPPVSGEALLLSDDSDADPVGRLALHERDHFRMLLNRQHDGSLTLSVSDVANNLTNNTRTGLILEVAHGNASSIILCNLRGQCFDGSREMYASSDFTEDDFDPTALAVLYESLGQHALLAQGDPSAQSFYMELASLVNSAAVLNGTSTNASNASGHGRHLSGQCCDMRTLSKHDDYTCFGMCGADCSCWRWVCGDCCKHPGCTRHDRYCTECHTMPLQLVGGVTNIVTGVPLSFSCLMCYHPMLLLAQLPGMCDGGREETSCSADCFHDAKERGRNCGVQWNFHTTRHCKLQRWDGMLCRNGPWNVCPVRHEEGHPCNDGDETTASDACDSDGRCMGSSTVAAEELVGNQVVLQVWRDITGLAGHRRLSSTTDAEIALARLLNLATENLRKWLLESCLRSYRFSAFLAGRPYRWVRRGWRTYRRYYQHARYYYRYWSHLKSFVKQANIDVAVMDKLVLNCPTLFNCRFLYE
mmetsp:Transcript_112828/g.224458  ORF Transcript_112828/g.224458 Transcript_112828/m.224458 type:complete len:528 (-) Transcript_112828:123-1706(-)